MAERHNYWMRQFLARGTELLYEGNDQNPRSRNNGYAFTLEGRRYQIGSTYKPRWGAGEMRRTISVAFTPIGSDDLRLRPDGAGGLPIFTVFEDPDYIGGYLEYDKDSVERIHWWSKFLEAVTAFPNEQIISEYIGIGLNANRTIKSLNGRLLTTPEVFTPLTPNQFKDLTARHD